ncbi:hypothetical protein FANTH_13959 [Fusarium anthophilum]|uniref:Glutamine amidotransferase domain-containing protein n=1 Tax=Fusarium anthophilum TaxID=48485 RepID=A0A8H4YL18_9HYPO|nr:hypothetical protein FANTH_13959 [Fusarium anthophilum]
MAVPHKPLRIAILQNDTKSEGYGNDFMNSFLTAIHGVKPDIEISIFDPIEKQEYPNLDNDKYDAIILSGGTTEHDSTIPWVEKMSRFVCDTVAARPDQTLIGICWGHQAIHRALGGVVRRIPTGPFVQVGHELTPAGKEFFPNTTKEDILAINTMHHTEVLEPAPGFQVLLARNEACLSANKNILTIQAHPEIGPVFAEELVRLHFEKDLADGVMDDWLRKLNGDLDNGLVWQRIVQWIETPADRR